MPDTRTEHAESRVLLWVQRVLLGLGAVLLSGAGLVMADVWVAQAQARRTLAMLRTPEAGRHALPGPAATPAAAAADTAARPGAAVESAGEPVMLASGAPIGELSIPRVALAAMVLQGDDARTLRRGPGHIPETALPGEPGTVAIAGHRDSFFRPIRHVRIGDDVFLDTPRGRFVYKVSALRIVNPHDVSVLRSEKPGGTLALITCFPFWVAGPAPDRFVVVADEVMRP